MCAFFVAAFCCLCAAYCFAAFFTKTVLTIDRLVTGWPKRHLTGLAAIGADGRVHLARAGAETTAVTTTAVLVASRGAVLGAAAGLVGVALAGEEFLLTSGERECNSAVATG